MPRGHTINTVIVDRKNAIAAAKAKADALSVALGQLASQVGEESYAESAAACEAIASEIIALMSAPESAS